MTFLHQTTEKKKYLKWHKKISFKLYLISNIFFFNFKYFLFPFSINRFIWFEWQYINYGFHSVIDCAFGCNNFWNSKEVSIQFQFFFWIFSCKFLTFTDIDSEKKFNGIHHSLLESCRNTNIFSRANFFLNNQNCFVIISIWRIKIKTNFSLIEIGRVK